jgi:hypothetical protein
MGSEWILGRLAGGVEWIQLAQDRGRWRAVVNAVMNLRILAPQSYLLIYVFIYSTIHIVVLTDHISWNALHKALIYLLNVMY